MYFIFALWGGLIGTSFRIIIRLELSYPGLILVDEQLYNMVVTAHGVIIIFFLVMPMMIGGFGNWLVPIILIIPDMAFARLNNFRFWLLPMSIALLFSSMFIERGCGTGWTLYPPLSAWLGHPNPSVDFVIFSLHLGGISSIAAAINFATTGWSIRVEALLVLRVSILTWCVTVTAMLLIVAMPMLGAGLTILLTDRHFNTSFFDPEGLGDPVLFIHLF